MAGQVFGLMEALWVVVEGVLEIEGVVVGDLEGEVAGLAIDCWIAGYAETFGVIESDGGVVMSDAGVKPGKAVPGEFDLGETGGLDDGFRGGGVALKLAPDLGHVFFETGDECSEERLTLSGDDACLVL